MAADKVVDASTPFGKTAERRLRTERIVWLTTTAADGTPQPNAVWFLWDGDTVLMYSIPNQAKLKNIARNPNVSLNLDTRKSGDSVVVLTGTAAVDDTAPPLHKNRDYMAKYRTEIQRLNLGTPAKMASEYSVAVRIKPRKLRGF
ncbi:MAG TPA: TIGR03667 family PPOX class F420-dependent oxidoreductase [Candidatus Dormibacteraeota bacterium]|nr:TIGR03667 family PPOX class F420-dependent oxidoreductase [Candidatus Dormibacteraeota bacterium]